MPPPAPHGRDGDHEAPNQTLRVATPPTYTRRSHEISASDSCTRLRARQRCAWTRGQRRSRRTRPPILRRNLESIRPRCAAPRTSPSKPRACCREAAEPRQVGITVAVGTAGATGIARGLLGACLRGTSRRYSRLRPARPRHRRSQALRPRRKSLRCQRHPRNLRYPESVRHKYHSRTGRRRDT